MEVKWRQKWGVELMLLALIAPIFIQLQGSVYIDHTGLGMVDSGGSLSLVPLPISLIACMVALIVFGRDIFRGKLAIAVIVATFLLLAISCVVVGVQSSKAKLFVQFMLPLSALLLGTLMPNDGRYKMAKTFLYFLTVFVPAQLLATWAQGNLALTHYLYVFSVYQHFQYVPLIVMALFSWMWIELYESHLTWICLLSPWIGLYAAAGNSVLALFWVVAFSCVFAFAKRRSYQMFLVPILIMVSVAGYFYLNSKVATQLPKYQIYHGIYVGKFFTKEGQPLHLFKRGVTEHFSKRDLSDESVASESDPELPINVAERVPMAGRYWHGISESTQSIFFGHDSPPPRNEITSAHNYYLDMVYNFGLLTICPILALIAYTVFLSCRYRKMDPSVIWMACVVLFVAVVDSNLKVTLRQPYPGLITFFLWGVLLAIPSGTYTVGGDEKK